MKLSATMDCKVCLLRTADNRPHANTIICFIYTTRQSSVITLMCWSISRQSGAAADNLFPQHCEITCKNPMKVKTMLMIPCTSRCADVNNCTIRPYQTRSVTFRQQTPEALEVLKLVPSMQVAELVLISSDYTPSVDTM